MLLLLHQQPPTKRPGFLMYFANMRQEDVPAWDEEDELLAAYYMIMREREK